jgi:hypothetical protein
MRCCRWLGVVVDNVFERVKKKSPVRTGLPLQLLQCSVSRLVDERTHPVGAPILLRQYSSDNTTRACLGIRADCSDWEADMHISAVISIPMKEPMKNTIGNHQIETIADLRFYRSHTRTCAGYAV